MPMKKFLLFHFVFLVFHCVVFAQSFEEKQSIVQGNERYQKGDYLKAEAKYKTALSKDAESIKGNFNLGDALYQQNKLDEAQVHFKKVLEHPEANAAQKAKAYYNAGKIDLDQKNYKKAMEHFKSALKLDPYDDESRYNYALAKSQLEKEENQSQDNSDESQDEKGDQPKEGADKNEASEENSSEENQEKPSDKNEGNSPDGQEGEQRGEGKQPMEEQIQQGEDGKEMDAQQALNEQRQSAILDALKLQEQATFQKIISQKAKKQLIKSEKDW